MSATLKANVQPAGRLLTPDNHVLIMIDHQSQMAFATRSIDVVELRNNAALVAKAASGFKVATILTTVAEKTFSGPVFDEIKTPLADVGVIDRTTMNCWEDERITAAVNRLGTRKIVLGGLWTSVCIAGPALSAIEQGYEVYVISDACGDVTTEAHERAMQRMIQVGVQPLTSLTYLLELQRDWGRAATYGLTTGIARVHGGGYGLGIVYASEMFGGSEGH
jgi:nicotinamidase-related amidase